MLGRKAQGLGSRLASYSYNRGNVVLGKSLCLSLEWRFLPEEVVQPQRPSYFAQENSYF